jgi:hypothetical protein
MSKNRNNRNNKSFKKEVRKDRLSLTEEEISRRIQEKSKSAAQQFIQTIEPEVECKIHGVHNRYMEIAMKGADGENEIIYYCMDCLTKVLDRVIGRMNVNKERRMVKKKINSEEDIALIDPMTLPSEEVKDEKETNIDIEEIKGDNNG